MYDANIKTLKSSEISLESLEEKSSSKIVSSYLEKVKAADVEKVKFYLSVVYFFAVTFLSVTLLI